MVVLSYKGLGLIDSGVSMLTNDQRAAWTKWVDNHPRTDDLGVTIPDTMVGVALAGLDKKIHELRDLRDTAADHEMSCLDGELAYLRAIEDAVVRSIGK